MPTTARPNAGDRAGPTGQRDELPPVAPTGLILIERDDAYRYLLARALHAVRFEVSAFRLTTEALEHLDRAPGTRLAVVDLSRRAHLHDGLSFARTMLDRYADARVALISADPGNLAAIETEAFGGVLEKTPECSAMALMIRKRLCAAAST